jgi:F0F1-type ATP synthase delta subunit
MKLNLQDKVLSPQDLKALIFEIRKYARWYAQTAVKMQRAGDNGSYEPPAISHPAIGLLREWNEQQPLSKEHLEELLAAMEAFKDTAPQITITLAAPAPGSLKQALARWCRQYIDPNILIEFKFNATLLGGMVVRYGSHVHDWSFKRQIMAARNRFPEVLRRV